MKRTAILIDLGFALIKLKRGLGGRPVTAVDVQDFARRCLSADEDLFRIYCYHCPPYAETHPHPLTRLPVDFSATGTFRQMSRLIQALRVTDHVAYRSGELSFDGWAIRKRAAMEIAKTGRSLTAEDFEPDLSQKGVDMKIGLDVAWLASKHIVDRIVLVTADSDFVPAMKFARREGIQVILVTLGHLKVKQALREHADEQRSIVFP